jgi:hypothetical protein
MIWDLLIKQSQHGKGAALSIEDQLITHLT